MVPLLLLVVGLGLIAAGWLVLRSFGPRLRVGRLLATTPRVTVAEARALAEAGARRYIGVDGRLDSEVPFEDAEHRPLVLRRTRLEARAGRAWRTLEEDRQEVPFEVREGLDAIAVDAPALDRGLVVVPRESTGTAADLGERAAGLAAATPVRLRIEQVSSVEHATVLGVPVAVDGDGARLTAGLGRPLVLTTLERAEAMRILAEGRTGRSRAAAALLGAGIVASVAGLLWLVLEAVT